MPDPETIAGVVITLLITGVALVATIELVERAGRSEGRSPKGGSPVGEPIEIIEVVGPVSSSSQEGPTSEVVGLAERAKSGFVAALTDAVDDDDKILMRILTQQDIEPRTATSWWMVAHRSFLTQAAAQEIIDRVVDCFPDEPEEVRARVREKVAEAVVNTVQTSRENV